MDCGNCHHRAQFRHNTLKFRILRQFLSALLVSTPARAFLIHFEAPFSKGSSHWGVGRRVANHSHGSYTVSYLELVVARIENFGTAITNVIYGHGYNWTKKVEEGGCKPVRGYYGK